MQYSIAKKIKATSYESMTLEQLYAYLRIPRAEAYEMVNLDESRRLIPFYDFDATVDASMDVVTQRSVVNWLRAYIKKYWDTVLGVSDCEVAVCTCVRPSKGGLKLSAHLYAHNVGSFDSALKLYTFNDAKHAAELREAFPDVSFDLANDRLFDISVYKSPTSLQKFRVLNSIKIADNDSGTNAVFAWCDEDDENDTAFTMDRLEMCMATVTADANIINHNNNDYNIKAKKDSAKAVAAPKAPPKSKKTDEPIKDDSDYNEDRSKYSPVTNDDCKRMMRALPDSFKSNRDAWRDIISAYFAADEQYKKHPSYSELGYDCMDMLNWSMEWSKCDAYPQATADEREKTLKDITGIIASPFEKKKKLGHLILMSKQYAAKEDYAITEDEIVPTYWDELFTAVTKMKTLREFVLYFAGCSRRMGTETGLVHLRMHDGFHSKKAEDILKDLKLSYNKNKLMVKNGDSMTVKQIVEECWLSDSFKLINTRKAPIFTPYPPTVADTDVNPSFWNMFTGWGKRKMIDNPERESVFLQHTMSVFTSKKEAEYFLNWMASKIQHPKAKQSLVVLYSEAQGTGKSSFLHLADRLFGEYALAVNDIENQVLCKFNSNLENRLILCCDEIDCSGKSITKADKFKSLVTNNKIAIEAKGRDIREGVFFPAVFLMTANNMTGLKLEDGDRRTQFLQVNASQKDNNKFWDAFYDEWLEDDYELDLFFTHLAKRDLTGFNAGYIMAGTDAQVESKTNNLKLTTKFLLQQLYNKTYVQASTKQQMRAIDEGISTADMDIVFTSADAEDIICDAKTLYMSFQSYCKQLRVPEEKVINAAMFGKAMNGLNDQYGADITTTARKYTGAKYTIAASPFIEAVTKQLGLTTDIFELNIFLPAF